MTFSDQTEQAFEELTILRRLVVREAAALLANHDSGRSPDVATLRALLKAHQESEAAFRVAQIPDCEGVR